MTSSHSPAVWFPTIRAGTGSDIFTERLCKGLNESGIRAEISWIPSRAEYAPATVPHVRPPAWANIAHVNSWLPRKYWPVNLPVVVTLHHLVHDPMYRPFRSFSQTIYHELLIRPRELAAVMDADAVTTVSEYVKETITAFSKRKQISVIYNWIDTNTFSPGVKQPRPGGDPFRIFMAGTHSRRKGGDLIPRFAHALGSAFEIRYAGGENQPKSSAANIVNLGRLSERQLIDEFQQCDAAASLSRYEGFGYTALEAIACGKPFIGFRTSGLMEVVAEDNGTLVAINDIPALADAARALREKMPMCSIEVALRRMQFLKRFSKSNIDDYIEIYTRLLIQKVGQSNA